MDDVTAFERFTEIRLRLRQQQARPVLAELFWWVHRRVKVELPRSPIGTALQYLRNNWRAFTRFLHDGRLEMDTNFLERAMRHVAVGRKNWMHVASPRGGKTMAILTSLIYSAKLHHLDIFAYLRDVVTRIAAPSHQPPRRAPPTQLDPTHDGLKVTRPGLTRSPNVNLPFAVRVR